MSFKRRPFGAQMEIDCDGPKIEILESGVL